MVYSLIYYIIMLGIRAINRKGVLSPDNKTSVLYTIKAYYIACNAIIIYG